MENLNRLKYYFLKECGPILVFRLNEESTLRSIKDKCCEIWSLNESIYTIYDDVFNNMRILLNSNIQDILLTYKPSDPTITDGKIVFYMMEKLVKLNKPLASHKASICVKIQKNKQGDNKSDVNDRIDPILADSITKVRTGGILKGINNYTVRTDSEQKINFFKKVKPIDNWWIFIIFVILYMVRFKFLYKI